MHIHKRTSLLSIYFCSTAHSFLFPSSSSSTFILQAKNPIMEYSSPLHLNESIDDDDDDEDDEDSHQNPRRGRPGIVVFSGGTAFNSASAEMASRIIEFGNTENAADAADPAIDSVVSTGSLDAISRDNSLIDLMTLDEKGAKTNVGIAGGTKVWHVLPVTDDGGSTAEIVRVLGGPAVGDIRSRLLRLAPGTTSEARAVRRLLGHRLVSAESWREAHPDEKDRVITKEEVGRMAREEWLDILEGGHDGTEHRLWKEVSTPYRSIIRSFLVHFHTQVLQTHNGVRNSQSNPPFDFTGGSVGNFFFAGARTFFGSLPAAIFLFSKVAEIPTGSRVLPAVLTEERLVLGAELQNKARIRGQYNISHPKPKVNVDLNNDSLGHRPVVKSGKMDSREGILSLHPSPISRIAYLLHDPTWQRKNQKTSASTKSSDKSIPYINNTPDWNDRHEINPDPNPLVLDAISNANCIVYGCGSLFTSVIPSLVLPGVGEAISERGDLVPKILLLNGWHDQETSWSKLVNGELVAKKMDATGCVKAIVNALDQGGIWSNVQSFGDSGVKEYIDSDGQSRVQSPPLVTDYITHVLYPIGTKIDINEDKMSGYCQERQKLCEEYMRQLHSQSLSLEQHFPTPSKSNRRHPSGGVGSIQFIGVQSIPANTCTEGARSGGQTDHRIFHPASLVDTILDLANGGTRLSSL